MQRGMEPFPHVRVAGGPRERGRAYGEQALDREDVSSITVRGEVMLAAKARAAAAASARQGECSAFAVLPEMSTNGHTLLGQNWDWLLHCFDTVVVPAAGKG